MKFFLTFSLCFFIFISCKTIDIDKNVQDRGIGSPKKIDTESDNLFFIEPEIIFVEMPVFVPAAEAAPKNTPTGTEAVRASNQAGIIKPQDYSHAAMVYNYHPDWVYEVYTAPLRVTDICLEPNETVLEVPFVSDSERWVIGAGVSHENGGVVQHIYIKPVSSGLEATLIINTDRRVYRIILRSFQNTHMPIVRWKYHQGIPNNYYTPTVSPVSQSVANEINNSQLISIDPRFLSFNYRITHSIFSKPYWLPEQVFDDGAKTYIRFPTQVLQRELPTVFENRRDILNHRVNSNMIIIDKLVEEITIRIGKSQVTIKKKKGK